MGSPLVSVGSPEVSEVVELVVTVEVEVGTRPVVVSPSVALPPVSELEDVEAPVVVDAIEVLVVGDGAVVPVAAVSDPSSVSEAPGELAQPARSRSSAAPRRTRPLGRSAGQHSSGQMFGMDPCLAAASQIRPHPGADDIPCKIGRC
jgi:hypothetical protein